MASGFTVWLTGLPGSGKSDIASRLEESLLERGLEAELIDEGEVRKTYLPGLGSGTPDEEGLTRLVGHVCHMLSRNGAIAIAAATSPSREIRDEIRSRIGRFVEVYLKGSPDRCEKGAMGSPIPGFVGLHVPYEDPLNPEVLLETDNEDAHACVKSIQRTLEIMEWIPRAEGSDYGSEDEAKITKRLKDLGYI